MKVSKTITHLQPLRASPELLQTFLNEAATLDGNLGPILFQLPPKTSFQEAAAREFLGTIRSLHRGQIALEPRHASWFESVADELLQEFAVARVAADPAIHPRAASPGGFDRLKYYRLHGSPRIYYSPYSTDFLGRLASRLRAEGAVAHVWCIFDNTASGAALENALSLSELLRHP